MFTLDQPPHWPDLIRPLTESALALGRLQEALARTPLHAAWMWRETVRAAVKICQNAGYRLTLEQLTLSLAGVPSSTARDGGGVAAGRRLFAAAVRLFRESEDADWHGRPAELWQPLWAFDEGVADAPPEAGRGGAAEDDGDDDLAGTRDLVRTLLVGSRQADVPLVGLLQGVRHSRIRRLSPTLARLGLPLALHQAGLVPKIAPALLGGRLPLTDPGPLTPWLTRALAALTKEATGATTRLADLTRQHRAWHALLAGEGWRRHSRAPGVLTLLAATPVLSASLVARHLGCTPQGAGLILKHLTHAGVLTLATPRSRWKIYLASDLAVPDRDDVGDDRAGRLTPGSALPEVDHAAIDQTLEALLADLERADRRAQAALAAAGA